jgi:hypothetical protein
MVAPHSPHIRKLLLGELGDEVFYPKMLLGWSRSQ